MSFRRVVQSLNLFFFLFLLGAAAFQSASAWPFDFYLRLDPILVLMTAVSGRFFLGAFVPALIVVGSALFFGRVFCSHFCPMGTTLEWLGKTRLWGRPRPSPLKDLSGVKYLVLSFLLGGALLGVSWVFWASPLSLITRFYGLVVYPLITYLGELGLQGLRPLAEGWDVNFLLYHKLTAPRFSTSYFVLGFFLALVVLEGFYPRFWCRTLCPTGALLALFSRMPWIRRRVSDACTGCGKCLRSCPTGAINTENPRASRAGECIVCLTCEKICPEEAVRFSFGGVRKGDRPEGLFSPERRKFLFSGALGAVGAVIGLPGSNSPGGKGRAGGVLPAEVLRPPASLPEREFLARCVRCGECVAACPTHVLQPLWWEAGLLGLFSPKLLPKAGYCDPLCRRCAQVCPTQAITLLTPEERLWVKTGTAVIVKEKCLAWEQQKGCMVCDEVCPYKAVEFRFQEGNPVAVPEVHEERCSGCGYCEFYCPVKPQAAIIVSPNGAVRLAQGSYREAAKRLGLDLSLKQASFSPPPLRKEGTPFRAPGFEG